ncbi:FRG domain-containing protein [Nocardioides sp. MAHUQ-72]|uniref:FRG domain-containing protein n=1 Tax=unclassified Nocardioides TaxID=2615069 RepID=UPI0036183E12
MVQDLKPEMISSLREYMERIEDLMAADVPLWYRGCGKASHTLAPSLFRHPDITAPEDYIVLERRILRRFRERSVPYQKLPQGANEEWDFLFLMQHFGVPTRLLDWTENPYVALFFALTSARIEHATGHASENAAVWILQPEEWNRQSFADMSYSGDIFSAGDEPLRTFIPSGGDAYMRNAPAAMFGLHNSPRIVAQRGVFTIFGKESMPMEERVIDSDYPEGTLTKFEFPAELIGDLRKSLLNIGITDSVIYPDLGGLANELKRFFGYEV